MNSTPQFLYNQQDLRTVWSMHRPYKKSLFLECERPCCWHNTSLQVKVHHNCNVQASQTKKGRYQMTAPIPSA